MFIHFACTCYPSSVKVPLGRKFHFLFFLHFRVEYDLLTHVTKFQSFTAIGSIFF